MVYALEYDEQKSNELEKVIRDAIAYVSDETWNISKIKEFEEVDVYLAKKEQLEVCFVDIKGDESLEVAAKLRGQYSYVYMLLIADDKLSPMKYLRPSIQPTALLLKPYREDECISTIKEFLQAYQETREDVNEDNVFVAENKGEKTLIPYSAILYFEAREKKVFIQTESEEISVYGTLNELEETLPDIFVRCHRSYLINKNMIKTVSFGQNEIEMKGGMYVPLSRSSKPIIKSIIES